MEMVDEPRRAPVQHGVMGCSNMCSMSISYFSHCAHEQKRAQMVVGRVGEVLKAALAGELTPAQPFVSELGIFGDHRHSKARSRIFRSVIVILPWQN